MDSRQVTIPRDIVPSSTIARDEDLAFDLITFETVMNEMGARVEFSQGYLDSSCCDLENPESCEACT